MPNSLFECIPLVKNLIEAKTQDKVVDIKFINKNRHLIITTEFGLRYWVLFKREFFMSFGKIFDFKGIGDSINAEFLGIALNMKIDGFLFVYKNGYVYYISPREIYDYGQKFGTIRITNETERTYSFPLAVHKRWR